MTDTGDPTEPWLYPYVAEPELRQGRTVLRPVVTISLDGLGGTTIDALVDCGSEPTLADAWIADALGLDLAIGSDSELIGIGGQAVVARFVEVTMYLHRWDRPADTIGWRADVGFVTPWRPLYPVLLGQHGFLDRFTVTLSRHTHALAVEDLGAFDGRYGELSPAV